MNKNMILALALVAATRLVAAGPDGNGFLQVDLGLSAGRTALDETDTISGGQRNTQTTDTGSLVALRYVAPLANGFSVGLSGEYSYYPSSSVQQSGAYTYTQDSSFAVPDIRVEARLFPGAWATDGFTPGTNANPDGWIWWPSFTIGYEYSRDNMQQTLTTTDPGLSYPTAYPTVWTTNHDLEVGTLIPVATFLTVEAGYLRNLASVSNYSYSSSSSIQTGAYSIIHLGVDSYINLVAGAGTDATRPFIPGFGRRGQLAVDLSWDINNDQFNKAQTQTRTLALGAPVSDSLALGLALSQVEPRAPLEWHTATSQVVTRNDDTYAGLLTLAWAFGSPESRVGGKK